MSETSGSDEFEFVIFDDVVFGLEENGDFIGAIVPAVPGLLNAAAIIGPPTRILPR
jgi:hypothetical protein